MSTYYRMASISKTISTIGLMTLFDEKKFLLEQDISSILGFKVRNPNFPDTPITIRSILSHTSSIREGTTYDDFLMYTYNQTNPKKIPNLKELLLPGGKWYSPTLFSTQPIGYFAYCNLNFGIAGTLIEILS
jgi:CubicO group peptidase (beta-lactamase class C family)